MPNKRNDEAPATGAETGEAHARIVRDYFISTSQAGIADRSTDYGSITAGLKRGLGDWLDVEDKVVIDLGCGTGELSWLACDQGASEVVGVNLSEEEIDFARPHVPAKFVHQDILTYLSQRPDDSVDRIYALNILEHLTKDDLVAVLEQSQRCLRRGGQLIAMVPNATSPFGTMTRYWDFTHLAAFTPSSVRQLQRLCGFRSIEYREWGPRPHGLTSTIRYLLWQAIRGMIWFRLMVELASDKGGIYTADMLFRLTK